jgi:hypothetical protein
MPVTAAVVAALAETCEQLSADLLKSRGEERHRLFTELSLCDAVSKI